MNFLQSVLHRRNLYFKNVRLLKSVALRLANKAYVGTGEVDIYSSDHRVIISDCCWRCTHDTDNSSNNFESNSRTLELGFLKDNVNCDMSTYILFYKITKLYIS